MNIGQEIITVLMRDGEFQPLLDAGLTTTWLADPDGGVVGVFPGESRQVYQLLLAHWAEHGEVMSKGMFKDNFPAYEFGDGNSKMSGLIAMAVKAARRVMLVALVQEVSDLNAAGDTTEATDLVASRGPRIRNVLRSDITPADVVRDTESDTITEVDREMGAPLGIDEIDDAFFGFQPGQLITLMGRQKAGKSWLLLNSALEAWRDGYTVLIFSIEMEADLLKERLTALGAGVNPEKIYRGTLSAKQKTAVRKFIHSEWHNDKLGGEIYISKHSAMMTVDDVLAEVNNYRPDVVYIDGVYFMRDRQTMNDRNAPAWQGPENIATDLATMAQENALAVVVTTQVQEKQHRHGGDIQASSIMGSTGLLKSSSLVLGVNKEDDLTIVNCVNSRRVEPPTIRFRWDFDDMSMTPEVLAMNVQGI